MFQPVKPAQWLMVVAAVAAMIAVPLVTRDSYLLHVLILAMIFGIFASAWNLVAGFAGLKTFGHHAFFGIGAYVSALISIKAGLSPWLTIWIGALAATVAGVFIGLPILRIKSMAHVAIVTLGFAEIVRIVISNLQSVTRGELGLWGIRPFEGFDLPGFGTIVFSPADKVPYYYLALVLLLLSVAAIALLMRSRIGLSIIAMRDAEDAAESLGVNLTRKKLQVFAISAFLVGIAGAFYAHYISILTPNAAVGADLMILVIAMALVGGLSTFAGPLVGALILTGLVELLRDLDQFRLLVYGAMIILIVMFLPKGLMTLGPMLKRRFTPSSSS
ncbi:branched-chain amino acid ABC transporter permease [Enterovirga rhinocerotis]|uniref:Amino acid/amide ABC transporter membrane protein 2 (HAAT family) n=1 Tax=Enterovirga rhinocerotis TaxID=1339210 RepID=A0A4R7BVG9_9HYPH|nr:branched-chain amino acid ABC transporter permease [Enterovirga rhinocerotis]TDR89848.1 amino acid/amide ABC transporter membrane protein 2 (HAAT family) [Enterovirga rhinocerotis]